MDERDEVARCPACRAALSAEQGSEGLCPGCLYEMALGSPSLLLELEELEEESETLAYPGDTLAPGQILGERYRVRALLGRGGMGEVWRAWDLKLRVDLALKALRPDLVEDARALETLRREVRTAREVISPHVCRVFDLIEIDGQELVSMEYIDGVTLLDILKGRAPIELAEARELATQFLAGLEAIHEAGLVHRDIKPENIMMTRAGRVVVMDLGIARGLREGHTGTISGTPAYMAPEQARGEAVTPRADVFSAGVVLAEMIAPEGLASFEARQALWRALQHEPPQVPDSAWAPVIRTAVARIAEERYTSAAALARALEEVTLRVAGAEDVKPYPGLASFTAEEAEYFFGRELEVEATWKKLQRAHLMALIGPSGAGKSSFLNAGLLPVMPTGWRALVVTPGSRPMKALAEALVGEISGDAEALRELVHFDEPEVAVSLFSRWRQRHAEVLVVVDQFEELFTQNPAEAQEQFADLLAQLALEADVHVLLSMRDDFLFHCSTHEALAPIFSEMTPLKPLSGSALRRALVQPALKCGYRFEDEALVDEMVAEVEGERGALPLLAFAASRLWDHRNREDGFLTREAYEHIGGVGGALAQHAEATLEAIGREREPLVRELFRNLVTSQGTRAARDRQDLVSVFGEEERQPAGEILDALIDARLLTSYETVSDNGDEEVAHHRIEIIHESLLSNWPRLVRWQSQDQEGALLRDQLRQAAQMWRERGHPEDLLWTGTSFKEYELWRERYAGGLSEAEKEFAVAMKSKAERRRRQKRIALATAFGLLLAVLAVIAFFGWQSELARRRAEAETLRAEANKLLAVARTERVRNPTAAMAYATKSLELADTEQGRRLLVEILWRGPVARIVEPGGWLSAFSPDGEWLAVHGTAFQPFGLQLISANGGEPRQVDDRGAFGLGRIAFSGDSTSVLLNLVTGFSGEPHQSVVRQYSILEGEATELLSWQSQVMAEFRRAGLLTFTPGDGVDAFGRGGGGEPDGRLAVRLWRDLSQSKQPLESQDLGVLDVTPNQWARPFEVDDLGQQIAWAKNREVLVGPLQQTAQDAQGLIQGRRVATTASDVFWLTFSPDGESLAIQETSGESSIVTLATGDIDTLSGGERIETMSKPVFSPSGERVSHFSRAERAVYIWDLEVPVDRKPLVLSMEDRELFGQPAMSFHPEETWVAVTHFFDAVSVWPLDWPFVRAIRPAEDHSWLSGISFSPDSKWLGTCAAWTPPHLWPLEAGLGPDRALQGTNCDHVAFDPNGGRVLVGSMDNPIALLSTSGGPPQILVERAPAEIAGVVFDRSGEFAAAGNVNTLYAWNLESGKAWTFDARDNCAGTEQDSCLIWDIEFSPDGALYSVGERGLRRWDVSGAGGEWVHRIEGELQRIDLSEDGRYAVTTEGVFAASTVSSNDKGRLNLHDLEDGSMRTLEGWGTLPFDVALDPSGEILAVINHNERAIRVGRIDGTHQHLLIGHERRPSYVEISPDGRWIATGAMDEVRLWPMPDLSTTPLHELPYDELLTKLHRFTNLRAVEDPDLESGWGLEVGPFPGWREVPEW
jgi:WD40 repeat protein